jgi:hypothetical protein
MLMLLLLLLLLLLTLLVMSALEGGERAFNNGLSIPALAALAAPDTIPSSSLLLLLLLLLQGVKLASNFWKRLASLPKSVLLIIELAVQATSAQLLNSNLVINGTNSRIHLI